MNRIFFWFFCVISLMYQYGLRTSVPSVLNDALLSHFSITAEELGFTIGSSYFVYMCMQMPVGFLLDRLNYRIIAVLSCVCSSLAIILFVRTDVFGIAYFAQILLGFSAAFAFPMIVKVAAKCFDEKKMTQVTNTALCFSALGPIVTSIAIAYFSERYEWKSVVTNIGFLGFVIALCLFVSAYNHITPDAKVADSSQAAKSFKKDVVALIFNRNFMLVCLYSMLFIGATAAFSDTWGVSFIKEAYGVSRVEAASCVSIQFFGIAVGGALFAYLVKVLGSFKKVMLGGAIFVTIILAAIVYLRVDFWLMKCLMFALGICGGAQCLAFPFALKLVSTKSEGFVTGTANTMTMLGSSITIPAVGSFIQLSKTLFNAENAAYSISDYRFGFSVLIISAAVSVIMIAMVREKTRI